MSIWEIKRFAGTEGGPQERACGAKEFEEPACGRANRRSSKGYRNAFFLGLCKRRDRRLARFSKPRSRGLQKPMSVPPIERFHWSLSAGAAEQYRRATIYPISNHREFPLAHANYRPICSLELLSRRVHSSPKVHGNSSQLLLPSL